MSKEQYCSVCSNLLYNEEEILYGACDQCVGEQEQYETYSFISPDEYYDSDDGHGYGY